MPQVAQLHRSEKKPAQLAAIQRGRPGRGGIAQLAQELNATQRSRDLTDLAQRMPVQQVTETVDAAHASEARWKAGRAVQRVPSQLKPLSSALMGSAAQAPMQFALWDYVPSLRTLGIVGAGVGAGLLASTGFGLPAAAAISLGLTGSAAVAATHAGGIGAGLGTAALGTAGVLTAGALPLLAAPLIGALAGGATGLVHGKTAGVLGAVGGALAPAAGLAALGSGFGATIGADVQSSLSNHPVTATGPAPSAADAIFVRAREAARRTAGGTPTPQQIVQAIDIQRMRTAVANDPATFGGSVANQLQNLPGIINLHLRGNAAPGAAGVVDTPAVKLAVAAVLRRNSYIKDLLAERREDNASVRFTGSAPPEAERARKTFNSMVRRPALNIPDVRARRGALSDPVSYMGDDGTLTAGWGTTEGNLVHELGHHLENNLLPSEFGTMHNFLMARSAGWNLRTVGTGPAHNKVNTGQGYDTNTPNPVAPQSMPLTRLGANLMAQNAGLESGETGIDRFVQSQSHRQDSSYATKIYPGALHTEFTATTIHLLAKRSTADALITTDPLRVCLFLYLARRGAYDDVRAKLKKLRPPLELDDLIHKVS